EAAADDDRVVRRAVADDGGGGIGAGHLGAPTCCLITVRPVLYDTNYEKQVKRDQAHWHLLRRARPARRVRGDDFLRHQTSDGDLDPELLARSSHHRLRGA